VRVFRHDLVLVQLDVVNHAANIRIIEALDCLDAGFANIEPLFPTNVAYELVDLLLRELVEPNTDELLLEGMVDFADIITNQEKLHIFIATLEQVFERLLGVFSHIIDFIQNHKLVPHLE
jgi:hypothetical protein